MSLVPTVQHRALAAPPSPALTSQQVVQSEIDAARRDIDELLAQLEHKRLYLKKRQNYLRSLPEGDQPSLREAVRPIIAELLRDNGSMEFDALYEFVKDRLDGERPANGVKQVVQRLLKEPGVREAEPGVYAASAEIGGE
jgi:hypothetical protein